MNGRWGRTVRAIALVACCCVTSGAAAQQPPSRSTRLPPLPAAPFKGPYDVKGLGLGTELTVVAVFASENCKACTDSVEFYKSVFKLPRMDGTRRRFVVVAVDGLWPVKDVLDKSGFDPHRLTSGPYPARKIPGVTATPTVLLLDKAGAVKGKWEGALSRAQQQEILAAIANSGGTRKE